MKRGAWFGLLGGITWAINTILIGIVLSSQLMIENTSIIFLAPLISTFLHDFLSSIWIMLFLTVKGNLILTFSKIKTSSGLFVILGAILGGPIGMTFYVLGIQYLGASYTAAISAICPATGAFFAFVFLKERLIFLNWIGLTISIIFIMVLGLSNNNGDSKSSLMGFLFVCICVISWSLEGIIYAYGVKNNELTAEEALLIRQLTSTLTYGILIIPLFNGITYTLEVVHHFEFTIIALTSLIGTASYFFYYQSIKEIGPIKAMALNTTYSAWAVVFSMLLLDTPFSWELIMCCTLILLGAILTIINPVTLIKLRFLIKFK
ncbi:TPA: DMT family transporter [Bacillus cereus]|uniref:DMT family transporter n=1 Tax=Bacillus cereus TaxID=1396 RepID=UPI0033097B69|nr:DMT family transporter [Bacillus cereus]MCU5770766.1 DMT family transporter [Bacillus cereus]HDR7001225.1 DMT family transporter [Bacillus cereus]HDR7020197.1 DMT family transporter [Bacillus cereus]